MKRNRLMYALPLAALLASGAGWAAGDSRSSSTSDSGYGTRSDTTDRSGSSMSDRSGLSDRTDKSSHGSTAMKDAAITAKVKSALMAERDLSSGDIKVETNNGIVQLSGFANSQSEIDRAVSVARNVDDVKSVENNMQTKDASSSSSGMSPQNR